MATGTPRRETCRLKIDPNRLTPEQLAKLLSAAAKVRIPVEHIQEDVNDGAPTNDDGTLNLVPTPPGSRREWDMATDPRKLRPSELCRLLNSTPLGEVISERQLHRHRSRAGHSHRRRQAHRPVALRRLAGPGAP